MGELLLELIIELFGEVLLTLFGRALGSTLPSRWKDNGGFASLGYVLLGSLGAGLSLLVWPDRLLRQESLRIVSFFGSPVLCALLMFALGARHTRRGTPRLAVDGARHGFLLGLSYQLVRAFATPG